MSEHMSAKEWREWWDHLSSSDRREAEEIIEELIAALAACEAERDRHEREALTVIEQREVAEIRAERLVKYTNHTIPCAVGENKPCTCGLDAVLAEAEKEGKA